MSKPRKPRAKADDRPAISILAALATKVTALQQQVQELTAARSRDDDPQTDPAPVTTPDGRGEALLTEWREKMLGTCAVKESLCGMLIQALRVLDKVPAIFKQDADAVALRATVEKACTDLYGTARATAESIGLLAEERRAGAFMAAAKASLDDDDDCCSRGDCR